MFKFELKVVLPAFPFAIVEGIEHCHAFVSQVSRTAVRTDTREESNKPPPGRQ